MKDNHDMEKISDEMFGLSSYLRVSKWLNAKRSILREKVSVKRYHKARKKHWKFSVVLFSNLKAVASSTESFLGVNTNGMNKRKLELAFKSNGMPFGNLGFRARNRDRKEIMQGRLRKKAVSEAGMKNGIHTIVLEAVVMTERAAGHTCDLVIYSSEIYSLNEDGYSSGRTSVEVFDPGISEDSLRTNYYYQNQGDEKYFLNGYVAIEFVPARLGIKFCKLNLMKQLRMVINHGLEVQRLAMLHGSDAEFISRVFDPGGIQAESVTILPDFKDQRLEHFNLRLVRYAFSVKVEREKDVLTHPRFLKLAEGPAARLVFEVCILQFISLLGDLGLNIQEVHAFSTTDGSSLDVCADIGSFNVPAMIPLWMFPLVVTCDNTVVLIPSEKELVVSLRLMKLALENGLLVKYGKLEDGDGVGSALVPFFTL